MCLLSMANTVNSQVIIAIMNKSLIFRALVGKLLECTMLCEELNWPLKFVMCVIHNTQASNILIHT